MRVVRRPWAKRAFRSGFSTMSLRHCRYAHSRPRSTLVSVKMQRYGDAMIRDDIKAATIAAMKGGDKETTGTLRLVQAAIKNRDIEARTGAAPKDDDALVSEVLQKMVKQRRESADIYRKNGREDRAEVEEAEIAVIERFLPKQLSDSEAEAAVREIVAETGASSMKDMGRVMALVKERLGGALAPARASSLLKAALS